MILLLILLHITISFPLKISKTELPKTSYFWQPGSLSEIRGFVLSTLR